MSSTELDDLTRLEKTVAKMHANDQLTRRFNSKAKIPELNFKRIAKSAAFRDWTVWDLEKLFTQAIREGRIHVADGRFWA